MTIKYSWKAQDSDNKGIKYFEEEKARVAKLTWRNRIKALGKATDGFEGKNARQAYNHAIGELKEMRQTRYVTQNEYVANLIDKEISRLIENQKNATKKRHSFTPNLEERAGSEETDLQQDSYQRAARHPTFSSIPAEYQPEPSQGVKDLTAMIKANVPTGSSRGRQNNKKRLVRALTAFVATAAIATGSYFALNKSSNESAQNSNIEYVTSQKENETKPLSKDVQLPSEFKPTYRPNVKVENIKDQYALGEVVAQNKKTLDNVVSSTRNLIEWIKSSISTKLAEYSSARHIQESAPRIVETHFNLQETRSPIYASNYTIIGSAQTSIQSLSTPELIIEKPTVKTTVEKPTNQKKPSISDGHFEVESPLKSGPNAPYVAYIPLGKSAQPIKQEIVEKKTDFIDANWFAQARIKAEQKRQTALNASKLRLEKSNHDLAIASSQ